MLFLLALFAVYFLIKPEKQTMLFIVFIGFFCYPHVLNSPGACPPTRKWCDVSFS